MASLGLGAGRPAQPSAEDVEARDDHPGHTSLSQDEYTELLTERGARHQCRPSARSRWLGGAAVASAALVLLAVSGFAADKAGSAAAWATRRHAGAAGLGAEGLPALTVLDEEEAEKGHRRVVPDEDMMWQTEIMRESMKKASDDRKPEEKAGKGDDRKGPDGERHAAKVGHQEEERRPHGPAAREADGEEAREVHEDADEKSRKHRGEKVEEDSSQKDEDSEARQKRQHQARSVLMAALEDLLSGPAPTTPAPAPLTEAHGFHLLSNSSCREQGWRAILSKASCEHAAELLQLLVDPAASETGREDRPEGCYFYEGQLLWLATNPRNRGAGPTYNPVREQICMTKARAAAEEKRVEELRKEQAREERRQKREEKKEKKEARKRATLRKEKKALEKWEDDEKNVANVTLYCISLMMPFGYEPGLLAEQERREVGIFACDEHVVFSNTTTLVGSGAPSPIDVQVMEGSLAVAYGGRWMTALNTGVFNRLWMEVIKLGRYRYHDWIVKADPDAVFFPNRLRQLIRHKTPYNEDKVQRRVPEPEHLRCSTCRLDGKSQETCAARVRDLQRKGHTCKKALSLAARSPPHDCGCECDDFACDLPGSAMYLNNCKWGLHGPIEVLSRRAVATYAAGLPRCVELLQHPWGEDKFLDQCMQNLGVGRTNEYSLLSETACGEQPAPCGTSNVAFHPFKSIQSYFTCYEYANKYGQGPEAEPWFPGADGEEGDGKANAD